MRVNIVYTLNNQPNTQLTDLLNWPDLSTLEAVTPYVSVYLDQKYGTDTYTIASIEEA